MRRLIFALLVAASLMGGLAGSALAERPVDFPGQLPGDADICTLSSGHAPWCP